MLKLGGILLLFFSLKKKIIYIKKVHVKNSSSDELCLKLRSVVERRAVTLKALFESLYGGSIYCLDCEFVPGFYSAYEE